MKKHYKPKLKNITKLKSYLNNADKKSNTGRRRSSGGKRTNSYRYDIYKFRNIFEDTFISNFYYIYSR